MKYEKLAKIWMREHPQLSERWVQGRIAKDPSILGLGDVILKDKERIQPRAGRLDLLLQEVEGNRRYEVEIQLGKTDESHIIRTVEHWDIERKRKHSQGQVLQSHIFDPLGGRVTSTPHPVLSPTGRGKFAGFLRIREK